ncbi:hypothetical protein Tco_1299517 [Tanacetum coccineum]
MTNPLEPRKDSKSPSGISNFTGRIRGMPIFIGNLTYALDFMIVEDISLVRDPRMSLVILGKPFVELSNMTYNLALGMVKFTNEIKEIAYKMPYKIEQYDSLLDMKKGNTKSVYFRNKEDKRRGVEYVMGKILGFYKGCLELGPEYRTRPEESSSGSDLNDQGGVTTYARSGGLILYQAYGNLYATTGRKAHLLGDEQISSVWVFDEITWETFGGKTRDLGSTLEETRQDGKWA